MLDVLSADLHTNEKQITENIGLSSDEAARLLKITGENKITAKKKKNALKIFAGQFHDIMVLILLIAMVISVLMGEYADAIPIMIIVVLNAALGFIQEYRCEKTLEKLEEMTAPTAKVYRNNKLITISASQIVPGDVIEVESGSRISCDGYIIACKNLSCDESILTGEAEPVNKIARTTEVEFSSLNLPYMAYMGTVVTKGKARIEAVTTGQRTQMGKVSKMLESIDDDRTPLQIKLAELGKALAFICIGVCILVFIAGVIRGEPIFDMFMTGITIAIAAIPEGLPATVTIALAMAVRKMLKRNALVHKLHSVETLGCASVICTDKTGTLTMNKMSVTEIYLSGENIKYSENCFVNAEGKCVMAHNSYQLNQLMSCAGICNNAKVEQSSPSILRNRHGSNSRYKFSGDPTETALLSAVKISGLETDSLGLKRIDEIPFESEKRFMSVTCSDANGKLLIYKKGAADVILAECQYTLSKTGEQIKLTIAEKTAVTLKCAEMADKGLRVLGFSQENDGKVTFLGLIGISDPPRPEAKKAVSECRRAGIKPVMITGDHKLTACAIAKEVGILHDGEIAITGKELDKMSDRQLTDSLDKISVYARVTPAHKLRIIKAFKSKGKICAMTGDGVNDAPAIKEASIGVSMGISGTDVTKQAADVILLDDNFATLVSAVREGRTIYQNIRKFVRYLISCNIGEVLTMFGGIIMGLPMVLIPSQILLVNLVTDGLPAVALGLEPSEKSVMKKPPRKESDSFFSGGLLNRIIMRGILIGLCTLGCFTILLKSGHSLEMCRTGALITLIISQLIHVFECKSEEKSLFSINPLSNPFLLFSVLISVICLLLCIYVPIFSGVFALCHPSFSVWLISLVCSFAVPLLAGIFNKIKS